MEIWTFIVGVVAIIVTLGGLIGLLMRQNSQAHALLGKRIDDTRHDLARRIDATDKRIDATDERIDGLRTDLAQRMDTTDKRIDDLRTDLAQRMDATDKRIDDLRADNREVREDLRGILAVLVQPRTSQ